MALLIAKLFDFLTKRETHMVNQATLETALSLKELTVEVKTLITEIRDGFGVNNSLLRECRDWHRDNNSTLSRIVDELQQEAMQTH